MEIIDLMYLIKNGMMVYPGTKELVISQSNTIEKDGFKEKVIEFCSHTGTHIQAPSHMNINEQDRIGQYEQDIEKVDFIIFKTGYEKYWGQDKYFHNYPVLEMKVVKYLMKFKLKGLGFDAISIDPIDSQFENHNILFNHNMIIIENLCNLDKISKKIFQLYVLPLKIKDADGSPVRAITIL
ncbi:MAG: cyclase family protein [Bacillota bacterium]|nr:cyclase family protein [Bacillota bacterium]